VNQLKGQASKSLNKHKTHPFAGVFTRSAKQHSPGAEDSWEVYLDTRADILRAIKYVEQNPVKEGKDLQTWPFTIPYIQPV